MKIKKALKQTAMANGVLYSDVKKEIQKAIDIGMQSSDPESLQFWSNIPKKGAKPSPEEVIDYITKELRHK